MRYLSRLRVVLFLTLVSPTSGPLPRPAEDSVSSELRALAARAADKRGWPTLRAYAESAEDIEPRGLAYFVLGYREYEAGEYPAAAQDLRVARETGFSLRDFAEYYRAAAAHSANQPGQAIEALEGFSARHPNSSLRLDALALLARALLQTGQTERSLEVLKAELRIREDPSLALLLAQTYEEARTPVEAAQAHQQVHYGFATAEESETAGEALERLQVQLGAEFPQVSEETRAGRAEILLKNSQFTKALKEYAALLQARPASPQAGRWKLDRARCLVRLKRSREAIRELEPSFTAAPELNAERLETLVEAFAQRGNEAAMRKALEELRAVYPRSSSYASALASAGNLFIRRGEWKAAARYYLRLAKDFPEGELASEANWRVAWAYYLEGQARKARKAFLEHLTRYPTSPYVPAAVYWLGRLAEEDGALPEARALFEFLGKRFAQDYYTLEARVRLKAMPPAPAADGKSKRPRLRSPVLAAAMKIPRPGPPQIKPCVPAAPSELLGPFVTLRVLSLFNLSEQYLRARLSAFPGSPELILALSRFEAEQDRPAAALLNLIKVLPNSSQYDFSVLSKEIWDLLYPRAFWELVESQARAYGLDPYLIMGLIRQESAFNHAATSRANARGLMQILPHTASPSRRGRQAVARKLYEPGYNVQVGCAYLKRVLGTFNENLIHALAAYNAGDPRVHGWLRKQSFREAAAFAESIPLRETRLYVKAVLRDAEIYRQLMTGTPKFKVCRPAPRRPGAAATRAEK